MERSRSDRRAVFICYRRADGGWAGRLRDQLEIRFGVPWQDVEQIKPGAEWPRETFDALRSAKVVLIVIGPQWIRMARRRLREAADVVRREIERALRRRDAVVIPVLVGGASLPTAQELPRSVMPLLERQAATLDDGDWNHGVGLLIERLREVTAKREGSGRKPVSVVDAYAQLESLQGEFFGQLEGGAPSEALDTARRALALLDRQLPRHPQDTYLKLSKGYFLKNEAMALRDSGDLASSAEALSRAESAFRGMQSEAEMNAAGVYNGIGNMLILRGEYPKALEWIDRALALYPAYAAARHDRDLVLSLLASTKKHPARRRRPPRR